MAKRDTQRARSQRPRPPDPPTQQQLQPVAQIDGTRLTVDASILLDIKEELGALRKGQEATNQRLDQVTHIQEAQAEAIQHIAQTQEQSAVDNERAHGEMRVEMEKGYRALGDQFAAAIDRKTTPPQSGVSEGRKGFEGWGKTMAVLKDYTPWLYGLGVLLAGLIGALLTKKGSASPP